MELGELSFSLASIQLFFHSIFQIGKWISWRIKSWWPMTKDFEGQFLLYLSCVGNYCMNLKWFNIIKSKTFSRHASGSLKARSIAVDERVSGMVCKTAREARDFSWCCNKEPRLSVRFDRIRLLAFNCLPRRFLKSVSLSPVWWARRFFCGEPCWRILRTNFCWISVASEITVRH